MTLKDDLLTLERGFWDAIRDPDFYREHMADDGLAVFSVGIMGKDAAIASTSGAEVAKWSDVALSNARVIELTPDSAVLVYEGSARRDGGSYAANCSSAYVKRDGRWLMALHQQSQQA